QPFRRLHGSKAFEGSGLGLAITAKIVRRHGGRVWADSDGVSGARFYFALPSSGEEEV
ncbi:MAG: ATP-binding protein, partial [Candidatus Rokuibacteriota bacterium]